MSDVGAASPTRPKPGSRTAVPIGDQRLRVLDVLSRSLAAIVLGLVTADLATAVLVGWLPGPVEGATVAATTFSFAVRASVAIWAFADRRVWRVWVGLVSICIGLAGFLAWPP